jgi:flavodoxin I
MAAKVGLIYGTNTGNTATIADRIAAAFSAAKPDTLEVHDLASAGLDKLTAYDQLLVGCPTWNVGELQDDWKAAFDRLDTLDLKGRKIAIFGVGDQKGYADNFQDAIGILGHKFMERGAELCAFTDAEDGTYEFNKSLGVMDGFFLGLAVDEDNQKDQTEERIQRWIPLVLKEFGLAG